MFGRDVDDAILQKIYGVSPEAERRYSPAVCVGADNELVKGNPEPKQVIICYVERSNFDDQDAHTRLYTADKYLIEKIENYACVVALHCKTLRITPAMAPLLIHFGKLAISWMCLRRGEKRGFAN